MRLWTAVLFGGLCLLQGSLWLFPATELSASTPMAALATGAALVTLLSGAWLWRNTKEPTPWRKLWPLALAGAGLISLPALLATLGETHLNAVMGAACLTDVPVVIAIATPLLGDENDDLQRLLMPALVALGGALLVLPVALPATDRGWIGLGLYLLASGLLGVCGVVCHALMQRVTLLEGGFTLAASTALVATIAWLVLARGASGAALPVSRVSVALTLLSAVSVAISLVLTRSLSPIALGTRYLWIPVVALVEACVLLRPTISARTAMGAALMLVGGGMLLRQRGPSALPGEMSLR